MSDKKSEKNKPTLEQEKILKNQKKNLIVSASAGSGKTYVVIEYLMKLVCDKKVPVSRLLVLTFTKAAANEMKSRLFKAILSRKPTDFLIEQLDEISVSDISTIDSFCEKIIKRNINKLDLDENFRVLDEKESKNIKYNAFCKIFDKLAEDKEECFDEIYFSFKRNKEQIFECMLAMHDFFDSQDGDEKVIEDYIENLPLFYRASLNYLNEKLQSIQSMAKKVLATSSDDLPPAYMNFKNILLNYINLNLNDNFFENCKKINNLEMIGVPTNKIDDKTEKEKLTQTKEILKEMIELAENFLSIENKDIEAFEKASLAKSLLLCFSKYLKQYNKMKREVDGLDFADIEKFVKVLINDKSVLDDLQKHYDYIFIDEYQDTNSLQEAIIKPIAQKGSFIAVGDPKQGIYGFRNASMEIMQNDIDTFIKEEDSDALFLTGNFRTDDNILTFINSIFNKLMTIQSVGIDYKKTSQLKGLMEYKRGELPPVSIDLVIEDKKIDEIPKEIYSVKNDKMDFSFKYKKEVMTIAARVEEILQSEIYDAKNEIFRPARESDIAILFRKRSGIMEECTRYLQNKGFNVFADLKQALLEDGQIQVLVSLLKLSINIKDDVSLVSVLNSWFGGFTLNELSNIRLLHDKKMPFYQIFIESEEVKLVKFKMLLEEFKFDYQVLGLTKAFEKLFNKSNYYLYINSLKDKNTKKYNLQEFFNLIASNNFEHNAAGLLNYLENIDSQSPISKQSVNAITITTIHATKGLEYPIVIIAGCGESLGKTYNKQYMISSKFGLGTYLFDYENDKRNISPTFLANKIHRKSREFVDELMIFYVALTRAQNHLYLIGSTSEKSLKVKQFSKCSTYFDLMFYSLGEDFLEQLISQEKIDTNNVRYRFINEIDESDFENLALPKTQNNIENNIENIKKYIDFVYKNRQFCQLNYKNTVSGLLKLEEEDIEFINQNYDEKQNKTREQAIIRGNAYHEALKLIDFNLVNTLKDLEEILSSIKEIMTEGYYDMLDKEILLKNIMVLKSVLQDRTAIKEKTFIMECSLSEILNLESDNTVIVQGIIDLFALGKSNVLIDYKYTSINNPDTLIERYKKQLELYALAIEKGFNVKVDKIYLLSLKEGELIEYR